MNDYDHTLETVAKHIGKRLKEKRKERGLSQRTLAESVGLTFQQIQKYENAANRISTPTLYGLAQQLKVPVSYFYDGLPGGDTEYRDIRNAPDGLELLQAISAIKSPASRHSLLIMAKTLASVEETQPR